MLEALLAFRLVGLGAIEVDGGEAAFGLGRGGEVSERRFVMAMGLFCLLGTVCSSLPVRVCVPLDRGKSYLDGERASRGGGGCACA